MTEPEDRAHARNSDPSSSHEAAESISSRRIRLSQDAVLRVLRQVGPCDDSRLLEAYNHSGEMIQSPSGIRTRRKELTDRGLIEATGESMVTLAGRRRADVYRVAQNRPESLSERLRRSWGVQPGP